MDNADLSEVFTANESKKRLIYRKAKHFYLALVFSVCLNMLEYFQTSIEQNHIYSQITQQKCSR
jgi:hypothetical protein